MPISIKNHLCELQDLLSEAGGVRCRRVIKDQMHITLRFFGEQNEGSLIKLKKELEQVKFNPFIIHLSIIGGFPNLKNPKVIWVGVEPQRELIDLQNLVLQRTSFLKQEQDIRFRPHITLLRMSSVNDLLEYGNKISKINVEKLNMIIDEFKLYQSELLSKGPKYTVLSPYHAQTL